MDLHSAPALAPPRAEVPAPRPRPGARREQRPVPQRSAAYSRLGLEQLRAYRTALQEEEDRVSYWRRILQARLDVVRAGRPGSIADTAHLAPALTEARVGRGRSALVEVLPLDDVPPLPSLAELWDRQVAPSDVAGTAALEADLAAAEEQLSAYRTALHRRMAQATDELIARYREQPTLCLVALPLPRPRPLLHG